MDVNQAPSSSTEAADPTAVQSMPPPPNRAPSERRICASAVAGGQPEHCCGFVVKAEPPLVVLCTWCLQSASGAGSRPISRPEVHATRASATSLGSPTKPPCWMHELVAMQGQGLVMLLPVFLVHLCPSSLPSTALLEANIIDSGMEMGIRQMRKRRI